MPVFTFVIGEYLTSSTMLSIYNILIKEAAIVSKLLRQRWRFTPQALQALHNLLL
jgi:hypothetical protein